MVSWEQAIRRPQVISIRRCVLGKEGERQVKYLRSAAGSGRSVLPGTPRTSSDHAMTVARGNIGAATTGPCTAVAAVAAAGCCCSTAMCSRACCRASCASRACAWLSSSACCSPRLAAVSCRGPCRAGGLAVATHHVQLNSAGAGRPWPHWRTRPPSGPAAPAGRLRLVPRAPPLLFPAPPAPPPPLPWPAPPAPPPPP